MYHVVYMPLDADGNGPELVNPVYDTWEVWNYINETVVACFSEQQAQEIVLALNKSPLYEGSVMEFEQ